MATADVMLRTVDGIRGSVAGSKRMSVTDFARSNTWRKLLPKCDVIEVVDRSATAGWLLSDKGMRSLLDNITYLEDELERAQIALIFKQREGRDDWASGEELQAGALKLLDEDLDAARAAIDGD